VRAGVSALPPLRCPRPRRLTRGPEEIGRCLGDSVVGRVHPGSIEGETGASWYMLRLDGRVGSPSDHARACWFAAAAHCVTPRTPRCEPQTVRAAEIHDAVVLDVRAIAQSGIVRRSSGNVQNHEVGV
jgi:hypothetical protein